MRALILSHDSDENNQEVNSYIKQFNETSQVPIERVSLDTPEGDHLAKVYDVVGYPAILVIREDGELSNMWQMIPLPRIDDVIGYLRA